MNFGTRLNIDDGTNWSKKCLNDLAGLVPERRQLEIIT